MYKVYEEMAKAWEIHLMFYDPMHQIHNSISAKMWQPKWREWTINLPSNTWRRRLNIMWGINAITHEFVGDVLLENCDIESTKWTLKLIRERYRNQKKIVIVLDNARYQRSYKVQHYAWRLWIELVYLPAYSPNLNLIERLWKFTKKILFANSYYETFEEFYNALSDFLNNLGDRNEELSSLINWNFQIVKCA